MIASAPIFVSVYDRPVHFKACIDSLAANKEAGETVLFISSDGPKDDYSSGAVEEVREVIKAINGFRRVVAFCPKENTGGAVKQSTYAEIQIFSDRYILTEDDNIFSPYALNYFNEGLKLFEGDPMIDSICGFMYPGFPCKPNGQIYLRCVAAWGIALWRDRDIGLKINQIELAKEVLSKKDLFNSINRRLPHLVPMIAEIADGRLRAGDVTRCSYLIKNGRIAVFPSASLVRNIGNDGSGINCGVDERYSSQPILMEPLRFDLSKPRTSSVRDERWVSDFFGGRRTEIVNKLYFLERNSQRRSTGFFICSARLCLRVRRGVKRRISLVFQTRSYDF